MGDSGIQVMTQDPVAEVVPEREVCYFNELAAVLHSTCCIKRANCLFTVDEQTVGNKKPF
jgi:hypothetical protein